MYLFCAIAAYCTKQFCAIRAYWIKLVLSFRLTGTNGLNLTLLTGVLWPLYCIRYSEAYFVVAMYTFGKLLSIGEKKSPIRRIILYLTNKTFRPWNPLSIPWKNLLFTSSKSCCPLEKYLYTFCTKTFSFEAYLCTSPPSVPIKKRFGSSGLKAKHLN